VCGLWGAHLGDVCLGLWRRVLHGEAIQRPQVPREVGPGVLGGRWLMIGDPRQVVGRQEGHGVLGWGGYEACGGNVEKTLVGREPCDNRCAPETQRPPGVVERMYTPGGKVWRRLGHIRRRGGAAGGLHVLGAFWGKYEKRCVRKGRPAAGRFSNAHSAQKHNNTPTAARTHGNTHTAAVPAPYAGRSRRRKKVGSTPGGAA
jgi:hypothetical protein